MLIWTHVMWILVLSHFGWVDLPQVSTQYVGIAEPLKGNSPVYCWVGNHEKSSKLVPHNIVSAAWWIVRTTWTWWSTCLRWTLGFKAIVIRETMRPSHHDAKRIIRYKTVLDRLPSMPFAIEFSYSARVILRGFCLSDRSREGAGYEVFLVPVLFSKFQVWVLPLILKMCMWTLNKCHELTEYFSILTDQSYFTDLFARQTHQFYCPRGNLLAESFSASLEQKSRVTAVRWYNCSCWGWVGNGYYRLPLLYLARPR